MVGEFNKYKHTLYMGRWPVGTPVGPIQADGAVVDEKGVQRFQVIDNGLYAASGELVGPIYSIGEEMVVPDDQDNCLYSIRRDIKPAG
ncbi:hypothetical protein K3F44_08935 [Pseudomonas sp. S07E 245]|uniref:hypothetical protein n=1 Tax=Pseudomonas sp. S07E 245 TaxID=2866278 RepID=UPI001C733A04|nr:hypothetical protein [Pseudomonas sp. S07E 245]QYX54398.1 hypothetical protein K3F44_08935 [Pseudomonas sp. S07E 245]